MVALLRSALAIVALVLPAPRLASAQAATCDPARLDPDSYRLTTRAQALNVLRPRYDWWDGFIIGKHADDLADLNTSAVLLAERARNLDDRNLMAQGQLARQYVVLGEDASLADAAWRRTLDNGGAVVWTSTLYDVDARSFFVTAFDRRGIFVYRFGTIAGAFTTQMGMPEFPGPDNLRFWEAMGGCIDPSLQPEAFVPWDDVREIRAANWVLYFKFRNAVSIESDRRKRKTVRELKVNLHGATGDVEFLWSTDTRTGLPTNVRGIGIGPTYYQRRVQQTIARHVDPAGRIKLTQAGRGAGW
jgi:hypothetical protein